MNNYEKILNMLDKNDGVITTKKIVESGIAKMFLTNLVKRGDIIRVDRGVYSLPNTLVDEYYIFQSKIKNSIFSHNTALYFYGLTNRVPDTFDVTIKSGKKINANYNVNIYYVKEEFHKIGVIKMKSPQGKIVNVYNLERTICDLIRSKNKIDNEIISYAVKKYMSSKNKNLSLLTEYADKFGITKKLMSYIEVIM